MTRTLTTPFDAAFYLKSEEECALYLQVVTGEANGDAAMIDMALADIARARSKFEPANNPPGSNPAA